MNNFKTLQIPGLDRDLEIEIHTKPDICISRSFRRFSNYEPFTTKHFTSLVQRESVVLDIGANIGYYSLVAGALGAKVHAFEPEEGNFELLVSNVMRNKLEDFCEVYQTALSDEAENAYLFLSEDNQGDHRMMPSPNHSLGIEVRVNTLDSYNLKPNLIKLDVQGYEVKVLKGGLETIKEHKPAIILECWPSVLKEAGSSMEELVSILEPIYPGEVQMIHENAKTLVPYSWQELLNTAERNEQIYPGGFNILVQG